MPVAFQMPFAAHRLATRCPAFGVEQTPIAAAGRFRSRAAVVLAQPPLEIGRPADIGSIALPISAAQDVDETSHQPMVRTPADINPVFPFLDFLCDPMSRSLEPDRSKGRLGMPRRPFVSKNRGPKRRDRRIGLVANAVSSTCPVSGHILPAARSLNPLRRNAVPAGTIMDPMTDDPDMGTSVPHPMARVPGPAAPGARHDLDTRRRRRGADHDLTGDLGMSGRRPDRNRSTQSEQRRNGE